MSRFTPRVTFELEFEGDHITMSLSRLQRDAVQSLMPYIETDEDGQVKSMGFKSQLEFSAATIGFLPQYVHDFVGLKDANGSAVTLEVMLKEVYFNDITTAIIQKLFKISRMSEETAGNLVAPSVTDMKDSEPETPSTSPTVVTQ